MNIIERDFVCKLIKNKPKELIELRSKFVSEVKQDIHDTWNNRKKLVMNISLLAPWCPTNWENMSETQLYAHFNMQFCTEMRYIMEMGKTFEQLLVSKVFGGQIKDAYAKEFNQLTIAGKRKCMANEYFLIWVRSILKKLIKSERYMLG